MRPVYKMKVLQIEITNACAHSCSNCTRFCGHHKKPFFMDFDTFKKAVDSLADFPGIAGVMGGEPTIHPEFEKFLDYYRTKIEPGKFYDNAREPIKNFAEYLISNDMQNIKNRRGLWSSLGPGYYKNFEIIQDTFPFQLINDHSHSGLHQTLLVTRKELGIPDKKWIEMRDNCWAQNMWSASITPKGAFFCEVAAALDMLFDGPGGWPIEPGWWKRDPKDFGDQLNWCEYCSAVLNVPRTEASLQTDIVSPVIFEKLKKIGSPKVNKGNVIIFPVDKYKEDKLECDYSSEWYLPSGDNTKRISSTNKSIYPKKLSGVIFVSEETAKPEILEKNISAFDNCVLIDLDSKISLDHITAYQNCKLIGKEDSVSKALELLDPSDWIMTLSGNTVLAENFREIFYDWIFNPGCLYFHEASKESNLAGRLGSNLKEKSPLPSSFILFNMNALALRDSSSQIDSWDKFITRWEDSKRIELFSLNDDHSGERLEQLSIQQKQKTLLMTQHFLSLWRTLTSALPSVALFGGGNHSKWLLPLLRENSLPMPSCIIDDKPDSERLYGVKVINTEDRASLDINAVVVSSDTYSKELTARAMEIWGDELPVINPYSDFSDPHFQK